MVGKTAVSLYQDARALLARIVDENWLKARAVIGFWPANSTIDDDISLFEDESRKRERARFHTLRQQMRHIQSDLLNLKRAI